MVVVTFREPNSYLRKMCVGQLEEPVELVIIISVGGIPRVFTL